MHFFLASFLRTFSRLDFPELNLFAFKKSIKTKNVDTGGLVFG